MRRPAAVDRQGDTGDGAGSLTAQEHNRGGNFIHGGKAIRRLLRQEHLADDLVAADAVRLGLALDLLFDQRRPDIAGTHRIACHAVLGRLERDNLGQPHHTVFGGDIG